MTSRAQKRDQYLRRNYGISAAEFKRLVRRFSGGCWICRRKPKPGKNHNVDHDHHVEKIDGIRASVRGVLCFQCNKRLIGRRRREHAELYKRAAEYLTSDVAQQILKETE